MIVAAGRQILRGIYEKIWKSGNPSSCERTTLAGLPFFYTFAAVLGPTEGTMTTCQTSHLLCGTRKGSGVFSQFV
jgi:hypothetical protein